MIVIMMHQHGMVLQEAVDFVGNLCKKSIDRFTENMTLLPQWGTEIDAQVQIYVQGLADWIVGSLHWSFNSERYFGKTGLEIKKSRVVELAPMKVLQHVPPVNPPTSNGPSVRLC